MKFNPTDWAALVALVIAVLVMANRDDPRWYRWARRWWSRKVGAWFARRRFVGSFTERRHACIRVGEPDEHSKGIMVSRRDVNFGSWS